jgi:diguanylate cyclase (GGDEF)-like protein
MAASLSPVRGVPVSAGDLVPLRERLRLLRYVRVGLVALTVAAWEWAPGARGLPLSLLAVVGVGVILAGGAMEGLGRALGGRGGWIFGATAVVDATFLAWAAYAGPGLGSPVVFVLLLQLTVVALVASSRSGVKLALWDSLLLISARYAQRSGWLVQLGNRHAHITQSWTAISVYVAAFWLLALATSTFAAVNERELRRRRFDLEALAHLALRFESAADSGAVADALLEELADTFGYARALVLEPRVGRLEVLASHGLAEGAWPRGTALTPASAPIVTQAIENNRRLLVPVASVAGDAALNACAARANAVVVPLHADRTLAVVVLEHSLRRGSRVERRVVTMLERFCSHAALALANAKLLERIRDQALTDTLTGLANRGHLDAALVRACADARRAGRPLAVAMLDLDHFKRLNDSAGHQTGDLVLQLTGAALAQTTRATDLAARYGGEEFCVLMPGATLETARVAAERLRQAIAERCREHGVTASVGVACEPADSVTPESIVAAADVALYEAKRTGRNKLVTGEWEGS